MKRPKLYRRRRDAVRAMRWTEDMTVADLKDFCDGLVQANDVEKKFAVYDVALGNWVPFKYGEWIIDDDGLCPVTHEQFMREYEEVLDAPAEP